MRTSGSNSAGKVRNSTDQIAPGVDTRGEGGYAIVPPSRSSNGHYVFENGSLDDLARLPTLPPELSDRLSPRREQRPNAEPTASADRIGAAMRRIPNPDVGWEHWKKLGLACWHATGGSDKGFSIWDEWSRKSAKYDVDNTRREWESITRSPPTRIGAGTIFFLAKQVEEQADCLRLDKDDVDDNESDKQSDLLIQLAACVDLFHDVDHNAYADLRVNGHRETYAISNAKSNAFGRWLRGEYYRATKSAPNPNAMTSALAVIEARAVHDGSQRDVHLRVAGHDGKIYLDLCDQDWRVVEIAANGWRVVQDAPVRFIRRKGMRALPLPLRGGSIETLRNYMNPKISDEQFVLVVAWLLATFYDRPYPVLDVTGEAGAAKSTTLKVLRNLTDPNLAAVRAPPRDERDLFIAAANGHVLCWDNLSSLSEWLSDALSRLATGAAFGTRQLFLDAEEMLFQAMRPILLGGIEDVVDRGDLADRCLSLHLLHIAKKQRRPEKQFWPAFEQDHPAILGALLNGVAHGLRELPNVHLEQFERMADFEEWGTACEGAFWETGTFRHAYAHNRAGMTRDVIEADMVANAVQRFMTRKGATNPWKGTATELLVDLENLVGEKEVARKGWPGSASAFSGRLRRAATPLRRVGIEIRSGRKGKARSRTITITRRESGKGSKTPSAPSAPSASARTPAQKPLRTAGFFEADEADAADDDLQTTPPDLKTVVKHARA